MITIDLMIGDYVTFKDCQNDNAPTIVKIEGLGYQGRGVVEEALVTIDGDENGFDLVEIDDEFVGIPLTPEILEKNFEFLYRSVPGGIYAAAQAVDTYRAEGVTINYVHQYQYAEILNIRYVVFRYVHELQHALRLCGIEKEIEL